MNVLHQNKCHELVDFVASTMKLECERLYRSGAVDVADYDPDHYVLAEILVTAAMHRLKDTFAPVYKERLKSEVRNLIRI